MNTFTKYAAITISFFISVQVAAQTPSGGREAIVKEINEAIWKPFISSFNQNDVDAFMAVHSKDVIRSPRDSRTIFGYDEYTRQLKASKAPGPSKVKRSIELRFSERTVSNDFAIDIGVYKVTMQRLNQNPESYYGKFMVVIRKESGKWKILVDTDSSDEGKVGEQDFLQCKPME